MSLAACVLVVDDEPAVRTSLQRALHVEGHRVLLARGAGADELAEARDLHAALLAQGLSVAALPAGRSSAALSGADVVTWEADVDAMLAAIGMADAYLGYDSAGQHVAAALGVKPPLPVQYERAIL